MSELKPCPFCGGEVVLSSLEYHDKDNDTYYGVDCLNYECVACGNIPRFTRKEDAINAWNRRAEQ